MKPYNYSVTVSADPAAEPLTRAQAKAHLRIDTDITDDDALVDALIQAAREWTENYCRRSWVRRTLQLRMDCFPEVIRLPRGPVSAITSVKYTAQDGTLTTLDASNYQTDLYGIPPRIALVHGATWPIPQYGAINAVLVTYTAGYAPDEASPTDHAANVPAAVKAAMKLLIGHWYENRELAAERQLYEAPFAVKALLAPFEIRDFTLES